MKLALALMFQNEAAWLRTHLPVYASAFDGIVALDGGSRDDSGQVVWDMGGSVYYHPFDDFGSQANRLFEHVEALGYDALVWSAPDELWFPRDIDAIRLLLADSRALMFPRVNFEVDRLHWRPQDHPDWQIRAWYCDERVRCQGRVHETVGAALHTLCWPVRRCPHINIYHYEGVASPEAKVLKHLNYIRMAEGRELLTTCPPEYLGGEHRPHEPFTEAQPLDPYAVGLRAPLA